MVISFKNWVENIEAEKAGIRSDIFGFLRDELNITSDEELSTLNTADIADDVRAKLSELGSISQVPDAKNAVKNGINIEELIDIMTQHAPSSHFTQHKHLGPTHSRPTVAPKTPETQTNQQMGQ